jgi:hypothetical protein
MMHVVVFASIILGVVLALCVARTVRVWIALKGLLELPNLVQIHRAKKPVFRQQASR